MISCFKSYYALILCYILDNTYFSRIYATPAPLFASPNSRISLAVAVILYLKSAKSYTLTYTIDLSNESSLLWLVVVDVSARFTDNRILLVLVKTGKVLIVFSSNISS